MNIRYTPYLVDDDTVHNPGGILCSFLKQKYPAEPSGIAISLFSIFPGSFLLTARDIVPPPPTHPFSWIVENRGTTLQRSLSKGGPVSGDMPEMARVDLNGKESNRR